jgi:glycosyltransferase involved in cell wall biosynthesis
MISRRNISMKQPGISVVLVTQNSAQGIDRLLTSFVETKCCNPMELIVVDKGSTDNTKQVIARYAQKIFIRLNSLTAEPTDAFCLNLGVSKAKYPLLIFFKPDNLNHSSDFDSVINFLEKPSDWTEVLKDEGYFTEKGLGKSSTTIKPVGVVFELQNASKQKISMQFMPVDDYRRLAMNGHNRSIPVFLCKKSDYAIEPFSWCSFDGKAIRQQTVKAYLDKYDNGYLYGWAASTQDDRQLHIDVYVDNQKITTCKADKYRTDLQNCGIWSGRHSFRVPVPDVLRDGKTHNVLLKTENDTAIKLGMPHRILNFDKKRTDVPARGCYNISEAKK